MLTVGDIIQLVLCFVILGLIEQIESYYHLYKIKQKEENNNNKEEEVQEAEEVNIVDSIVVAIAPE